MGSDLVTATPGLTWLMPVRWPHVGPLWAADTGWHPRLRQRVEQLLRQAQQESTAPLLVAPLDPLLPYIQQTAAANGVRAFVVFDVELGELVCQLQTMEAFPDV